MTIVEGVGGALVPVDRNTTVLDMVKELQIPVIIVAGNKLGTINHTLLTVEAVKMRRMKLLGIIFNDLYPDQDEAVLNENAKISAVLSGEKVLGQLPNCHDLTLTKKIARKIFASIKN